MKKENKNYMDAGYTYPNYTNDDSKNIVPNKNKQSEKEKEFREKIDKIFKTYLARTTAVNQLGLREELLELVEKEVQKERNKCLKEYSFKCSQILREAKQKLVKGIEKMIDKEMVWVGKSFASTGEIGYLNGVLDGLKQKINQTLNHKRR